eukprot:SM000021S06536  [mRNA]  locus=s21:1103358:1105733:- [translate_table: standard]
MTNNALGDTTNAPPAKECEDCSKQLDWREDGQIRSSSKEQQVLSSHLLSTLPTNKRKRKAFLPHWEWVGVNVWLSLWESLRRSINFGLRLFFSQRKIHLQISANGGAPAATAGDTQLVSAPGHVAITPLLPKRDKEKMQRDKEKRQRDKERLRAYWRECSKKRQYWSTELRAAALEAKIPQGRIPQRDPEVLRSYARRTSEALAQLKAKEAELMIHQGAQLSATWTKLELEDKVLSGNPGACLQSMLQ